MMHPHEERHEKQKRLSIFCFRRNPNTVFILLLLVFSLTTRAQSVKDTIYYDNYWRICERPVARYYRLGELQLGQPWHYVNDVKDYYSDGQLEMSGHYDANGRKNGAFTFYHPNGKIRKQGSFVNDSMKGTWSYYDAKGELYFQLTCRNNQTFTPLFIKNPGGDTLLKNGTGQFAFKLLDYPDVFPVADDYMIKGQCEQGMRTGAWTYDAFVGDNWRTVAVELYEADTFRSGKFGYIRGTNDLRQPAFIVVLNLPKFLQTEAFTHDPVFGDYVPGMHVPQLTSFLQHGDVPVFASGAKKFEANVADYLALCAAAVGYGNWADSALFWHGGSFRYAKLNKDAWLLGYCIQADDPELPKQSDLFPVDKLKAYAAQISFHVYEDGTPSDVAVKGNFEKDILLHMAYYLSRLTGLSPLKEGGKTVAAKQNLYLFTKVNTATYRKHSYIVYRLFFSLKPEAQTEDKFDVADYASGKFEEEEQ